MNITGHTRSQVQGTTWRPGRELAAVAVQTLHTLRQGQRNRCRADVGRRWDEVVQDTPDTPR